MTKPGTKYLLERDSNPLPCDNREFKLHVYGKRQTIWELDIMSFQIPFKPEFFPGLTGESSLKSLLHISSLAYDLIHRSRGRIHIYELNSKLERAY